MFCNKITVVVIIFVQLGLVAPAFAQSLDMIQEESKALAAKTEQEAQRASTRWSHAKELLGKYYKKSIVRVGEGVTTLDDVLSMWTKKALKGQWKNSAFQVSKTILTESERYGFDPVFLMAVIQNESSFNPGARGQAGEIGLMQLIPETAKWVTKKYGLPWKGDQSLKDPVTNIQIGAAYLAYLREKFDFHSQLYLAAYNMGSGNVHRAMERQIWPKRYSAKVMQHYVRFYSQLSEEIEKNLD